MNGGGAQAGVRALRRRSGPYRNDGGAYPVRSGEESPSTAVRRNLAVGPPSVEQIYCWLNLDRERVAQQPPLPVIVLSRLVDAPRRMWSYL